MLRLALCVISQTSVSSNWSYGPQTPNSGQNPRFFVSCVLEMWRMNLKKQWGASLMPHEPFRIISSPYVNSNWSYGTKTAKLGFDICDLSLWPLTLIVCKDITSVNGNNNGDMTTMGNVDIQNLVLTIRQGSNSSYNVIALYRILQFHTFSTFNVIMNISEVCTMVTYK